MQAACKHFGALGRPDRAELNSRFWGRTLRCIAAWLNFRHVRQRVVKGIEAPPPAVAAKKGPRGDAVLEIDPVAGGYPEQVGGAPDHVILELADLTVGVDQLPHHLDNAQSA